jgi:hypothetical protein
MSALTKADSSVSTYWIESVHVCHIKQRTSTMEPLSNWISALSSTVVELNCSFREVGQTACNVKASQFSGHIPRWRVPSTGISRCAVRWKSWDVLEDNNLYVFASERNGFWGAFLILGTISWTESSVQPRDSFKMAIIHQRNEDNDEADFPESFQE